MDAFVMLQELLEQEQFELIFPEKNGQNIRLVYLMNDAAESFLVFHDAELTGTYQKEYEGEIDAALEKDGEQYVLIVRQGETVCTLFFSRLSLEVHLFDYGKTGHFWVDGYEYLRQIEFRIAILRDKLEEIAAAEYQNGGKYIRPIVLFQAQPKGKEDATTFEKLRDKLVDAGIPAEQIAIRTADVNELKNTDLMSPSCPIRYIITVNALKEGWDCPFAYILASLANKTSQVDVEQILGRILRLPHTSQHTQSALNMSYVLTSSNDFNNTVAHIVKGLNSAGFSDKDYRIGEATKPKAPEQTAEQITLPDPQGASEPENAEDDFAWLDDKMIEAAIAAMEQNIRQYEAENKTGNPVLDTLLTAKSMDCQQRGINMTSVADGSKLGFLTTRELCTLVGAPLDNAIECVTAEPDPEKRLIKVAVYSQGGFAMLRFEHYTETAPALDADGLPQGTDLKSVRTTVGQHGGSMTMHWENNWCTLRILFPLPKK